MTPQRGDWVRIFDERWLDQLALVINVLWVFRPNPDLDYARTDLLPIAQLALWDEQEGCFTHDGIPGIVTLWLVPECFEVLLHNEDLPEARGLPSRKPLHVREEVPADVRYTATG